MSLSALPGPKGSAKSVSQNAYVSPSVTDWNALVAAVDEMRGTVSFIVNVKDPAFGAAGDGVTDDYAAFQAAITAFNSSLVGKGKFLIPPGTYRINKYVVDSPDNGIRDFTFSNLDGFIIEGYGAKLDIKGDFNRSADVAIGGGDYSSYSRSIIPMLFSNCKHGTIRGLQIDQNVDQMTRGATVVEGYAYGILVGNNSQHLKFEDLNVHHSSTDAISIQAGSTYLASKNITVQNCEFWANARIAGSVIQGQNVIFLGCTFKGSGYTNAAGTAAGSYTGHSPQCAVDIEPDYTPTTSPSVDVLTSGIVFHGCRFEQCVGSLLANGNGMTTGSVLVDACVFDDTAGAQYTYAVVMACQQGVIQNSYLKITSLFPTWSDAGAPEGLKTTIRNNYISSASTGITSSGIVQDVEISGNTLYGRHTTTLNTGGGVYFPYLQTNTKLVFKNNNIFLPAVAHPGSGGYFVSSLMQTAAEVSGNIYRTDLTTAAQYFAPSYDNSVRVENEHFPNSTYWRSNYTGLWDDTAYPYRQGEYPVLAYDNSTVPGNITLTGYMMGRAAIAIGATSCVVTIGASYLKASDHVDIMPLDLDATALRYKVTVASGSFTVTVNAAATAAWKFGFRITRRG